MNQKQENQFIDEGMLNTMNNTGGYLLQGANAIVSNSNTKKIIYVTINRYGANAFPTSGAAAKQRR